MSSLRGTRAAGIPPAERAPGSPAVTLPAPLGVPRCYQRRLAARIPMTSPPLPLFSQSPPAPVGASLTGLSPPLRGGRHCACAGLPPNKAGGPPPPPYRRVRILPPSRRRPGDWSVSSRPAQTAGRAPPPLKGEGPAGPPFRPGSERDWRAKMGTPAWPPSRGAGETRPGSLGPQLPTSSPSTGLARPRASLKRSSRRPLCAATWRQ